MLKLKKLAAVAAIALSSVAASCSGAAHAKEVPHECVGHYCSVSR